MLTWLTVDFLKILVSDLFSRQVMNELPLLGRYALTRFKYMCLCADYVTNEMQFTIINSKKLYTHTHIYI